MIQKNSADIVPPELLYRVDELCNEFEQSLKLEKPLKIDEVLEGLSDAEKVAALPELLWLEWAHRRVLGEPIDLETYLTKFPDFQTLIRDSWELDQNRLVNSGEEVSRHLEHGRYELKEILAEGGLGRIWIARDHALNRDVAVKIVSPHLISYASIHERFRREARIISILEHPGIAPIHSVGTTPSGNPYIAMRLVPGITLQQKVAEVFAPFRSQDGKQRDGAGLNKLYGSLEFREILGLFIFVCKVIDFAHQKSIIHRDIKPSNIIVGKFGEATVIDWGLGKQLGDQPIEENKPRQTVSEKSPEIKPEIKPEKAEQPSQVDENTLAGEVLGTPAYMSPEQAEGLHEEVGIVSDVFSLGASLFFLLTGSSPGNERNWENKTTGTKNKQSYRLDFPSATPGALQAICRKAMAESKSERYPTASALANDLECWLAYKPVSVYKDPLSVKAQRWIRYYPRWSAALATLAVLSFGGLFLGTLVQRHNNRQLALSKRDTAKAFTVMYKLFEALNPSEYLKSSAESQNNALMSLKDAGEHFSDISHSEITEGVINQLVLILCENDRAKEAMQIVDRAIENQSEKQRQSLVYYFLKGKVLLQSGQVSEAEDVFKKCIATWGETKDQANSLRAEIELARCAEDVGKVDTLQRFVNLSYPKIKKTFGSDSLEWRSAEILAAQYWLMSGQPQVAIQVLEKVKAPEKQGMLWVDYQLRLVQAFEANQDKLRARTVLKEIASKLDNTVDPKHRLVVKARLQLGNTLWQVRHFDEAKAILTQCLESLDEASSIDGPHIATCNLQIAEALIGKEDFEAAVPYMKKCIELRQLHYGDRHPETLRSLSVNGRLMTYLGKYEEVEKSLGECLKLQTEMLGEDHEDVLNTRQTLAGCFANLGKLDAAVTSFEALLKSYERIHGELNPTTLNALANLACLQQSQGDKESAKKGLVRHYQGWKKISDADPGMVGEFLVASMLLANCQGALQEKEEATKLFAEAVHGQIKAHGIDHPDVYTTLYYARTVLPHGCDSLTLIDLHRTVLTEMDKSPIVLWEKKTEVLDGIAEVYYKNQQFQEALSYLQQSRKVIPKAEKLSGDIRSVDSFVQNRFRIAEVAFELGDLDLCEECLHENDGLLSSHPERTVYKLRSVLWQIACAIERQDSQKEKQLRDLLEPKLRDVEIAAPYNPCIENIVKQTLRE